MIYMIHLLKFLIGLLFLLYACKLDIEARIVPNRIWKYMLAILLPFLIVEFIFYKYTVENLVFAVLQLGMMAALAYVFYLVGAYGGADAKALIVISILFPIY
ncbi:MAG: peptidase A24, partial [Candidatus Methanomethylicota archaeon]